MGALIAILFLIGAFVFCALVASWFVEGTGAITIVAVLIFIGCWVAACKKK